VSIICEKKPDIIRTFVVLVLVHELYLSINFKYLFYCTCNQVVVAKRILVDQINPMIYMFFDCLSCFHIYCMGISDRV